MALSTLSIRHTAVFELYLHIILYTMSLDADKVVSKMCLDFFEINTVLD